MHLLAMINCPHDIGGTCHPLMSGRANSQPALDVVEGHRRTSQGVGGLQPPQTRAKPLFFGQKLNFSGRSQQPKMKKIYNFVFIKYTKKTEFIPFSEIKCIGVIYGEYRGARTPTFWSGGTVPLTFFAYDRKK